MYSGRISVSPANKGSDELRRWKKSEMVSGTRRSQSEEALPITPPVTTAHTSRFLRIRPGGEFSHHVANKFASRFPNMVILGKGLRLGLGNI